MPVSFDQHTILLVDDEEFSRSVVGHMLRRLGFKEVLVAESGYQATELLNTRPVTVMLTDFRMPGMHGLQLLKSVRTGKTKAPRNLPCAMLTGYADRNLVSLAIVLDINTFLAKPASPDAISKRLGHCLQYLIEPLDVSTYEAVRVDGASAADLAKAQAVVAGAPEEPLSWDEEERAEREAEKAAEAPSAERKKAEEKRAERSVGKTKAATQRPDAKPKTAAQPAASAAPAKDRKGKRVVEVDLADVPENAELARNLVGSNGTLLLAAGTQFKQRYIKRLEELSALNEKTERVAIYVDA
jgi:two-component system chemotaxis response regulator CheY